MGGDTAKAFVGAQQDPWDSQKDMALAALAACLTLMVAATVNYFQQRDLAREWALRGKTSS